MEAVQSVTAATRRPSPLARTLRASIGCKAIMAVTGIVLLLFTIGHMLGNLQVFAGPDRINAYAAKLRGLGPLLWLARAGLLATFLAHVFAAVRVWRSNQAARPVPYAFRATVQTSYAARTMIVSGFLVLAFVVYHLLHFTFGATHPEQFHRVDALGRHDVYYMVVAGFREWPLAASYIAAQALLCLHISHGASSAFQTLGVTHPRWRWLAAGFGPAIATVIATGNIAIPAAALLGILPLPASA